ncbi:MAG: esterase family protein [Bacteroidales bacterium]|nr:esterase family protein [Bacteroidales bacterium]
MKNLFLSIYLLTIPLLLNAAKVDTLVVYSNSMKKNTKTCVVIPDNYDKTGKSYPVLYLLHGYSGSFASWVNDYPQIKQFADQYNIIIVGVDGNFSSWYFDSPVDTTMKYETYVTKELIGFIDFTFNTIKSREGRAVTGLSMGGHGALYLSIRHQDIFGASGSMSGGVDFRPFPLKWDLALRLGDMALYPENWEKNTVIYQLYRLKNDQLAIIIDCGIDDFFIAVNRQLHEKMLYLNISHDYIERPGGHTREYWSNALYYQVLYFNNFFRKIR